MMTHLCRLFFRSLLPMLGLALSFACNAAEQAAPAVPETGFHLPSSAASGLKPAQASSNYRISPTDIIEITVFQEENLKSLLRVSNEGTITFPLIGVVDIKGLSTHDASQVIADRLSKGYLVNPQVTVTVMEFSKRRFTVLGQVQKPGSYDMPDQQDVTLLQAIGMAGGYTRIANANKVNLMRKVDGAQKVFPLNAKKMANGDSEGAFMVQPGDVITISESTF